MPDDKSVISSYVRDFSERYDYVITSGGIGPTHDDITFESVGAAFDEDVYVHPVLESYGDLRTETSERTEMSEWTDDP